MPHLDRAWVLSRFHCSRFSAWVRGPLRLARMWRVSRRAPFSATRYASVFLPRAWWCGQGSAHRWVQRRLNVGLSQPDADTMAMSLPTGERLFFPPSDEPRTVYRCFWRAVRLLDAYDATEYLQPGMTVIDAGAHLGSFALLASQLVGDEGRVYAVEPISAEYLRRCVADNQLGNVEVCPVALADEDGELSLQLSTQSGMHSAVIGPSQRTITVPKRTLDGLVAEWGLASVDFIKVDVEGYEPQVLQGARETIARFRPVLALAAYHFPEHRQLLPQMIHDLVDDYAVHVGKACSGLELKCWGVPRERLSRPTR